MSRGRSLRRLWRHPYVFVAAAILFASGLATVGGTLASWSAQTENQTGTFAAGWVEAPTGLSASPSGYDAALSWTPGTHGVKGEALWDQDNGSSSTCPPSGYSLTATMASASTSSYTASHTNSTTLSGAITAVMTTISVTSAAGFPTSGNYTIEIDNEQMTVTGGQGTTTWTVTRAANGTTAAPHASGALVWQLPDAYNGHYWCYQMISTSVGNWTATGSFPAMQLGLVPTAITVANHGTSGAIDKTDVITLTFNQQTTYPTTSQTVNVCSFTSGVVLIGDASSCASASTDTYTIGKLTLNSGSIGSADSWATSTAIASTSSPWTITVTLGASGNSHKSLLTSQGSWTLLASNFLDTQAATDRAPACTSATYNCTPTTSGGGF